MCTNPSVCATDGPQAHAYVAQLKGNQTILKEEKYFTEINHSLNEFYQE